MRRVAQKHLTPVYPSVRDAVAKKPPEIAAFDLFQPAPDTGRKFGERGPQVGRMIGETPAFLRPGFASFDGHDISEPAAERIAYEMPARSHVNLGH